jgi:hypothetical protein
MILWVCSRRGLCAQLPHHWRVRTSFTVLIGKLGKWLDRNPAALTGLLDYIVNGLGMPRVGTVSAEALQVRADRNIDSFHLIYRYIASQKCRTYLYPCVLRHRL